MSGPRNRCFKGLGGIHCQRLRRASVVARKSPRMNNKSAKPWSSRGLHILIEAVTKHLRGRLARLSRRL